MTKLLLAIALLLSSLASFAQDKTQILDKRPFAIGETVHMHSEVLNETRALNIYLPASYDSNKAYPVIYLLDGSAEEDFIHVAGLVQFGSFSWINQVPESIVVGIANVDRKRDFTFPTRNTRDQNDFPSSGGSANFIKFIADELQPLIAKNYRTNQHKTIIGQSLGGLLATEVLLKAPELFDNYIIISPSLWWDDESLLALSPVAASSSKSVYVGVGKEGKVMERVARSLFAKVKSSAKEANNSDVHFNFFEQLSHGDTLHLAVYDAFDKVFRAKLETKS